MKKETNHKRLFPSFTLAELEERVVNATPETAAKMKAEIEARKNGTSKPFVVPQAPWN